MLEPSKLAPASVRNQFVVLRFIILLPVIVKVDPVSIVPEAELIVGVALKQCDATANTKNQDSDATILILIMTSSPP